VHDGGRVVLGQDGPHQHTLHEVLVGHQHMEAVPTVLDACLQDLEGKKCPRGAQLEDRKHPATLSASSYVPEGRSSRGQELPEVAPRMWRVGHCQI
jgi:hypothetical protein